VTKRRGKVLSNKQINLSREEGIASPGLGTITTNADQMRDFEAERRSEG